MSYAGRFMSFVPVVLMAPVAPVVEVTVDFPQPAAQSASVSPTRTYQGLARLNPRPLDPTKIAENCYSPL